MLRWSMKAGILRKSMSSIKDHTGRFPPSLMLSRSIFTMPPGAWDSHVHVVNEENFPFAENHPFRPMKADLDDLLSFEKKLGIDHVALVAISVYGNDNRLLLDRLRQLNGRGRGVVSIDPETITDAELRDMHSIGVRGARINLKSNLATLRKRPMVNLLQAHAKRLQPLKWSLHLHVELVDLIKIYELIPQLGVDVVLDHMGSPNIKSDPRSQKGYNQFIDLLSKRQIYVKLSGLYRFERLSGMERFVKKVLELGPTQVIWASDWPHTGGAKLNPDHDRTKLQEYRKVDVPAFLEDCLSWCKGDKTLMHKILVDNPRRLWQYED